MQTNSAVHGRFQRFPPVIRFPSGQQAEVLNGEHNTANPDTPASFMSSSLRLSAWFTATVLVMGSMLLVEYVALLGGGRDSPTHPRPTTQPPHEAAAAPVEPRLLRDSLSNDGDERAGEDEGEREVAEGQTVANSSRRLAVVVPIRVADLRKAQASLAAWPTQCHSSTLVNTDLVAYYAGGDNEHVAAMLATIEQTGGRCFARTRLVLAHASDKVGDCPMGLRVMLYLLCFYVLY